MDSKSINNDLDEKMEEPKEKTMTFAEYEADYDQCLANEIE